MIIAHSSKEEMSTLSLAFHSKRPRFDQIGEAQNRASKECSHKDCIEDYQANCKDEFEVQRKIFSRLPSNLIRLYKTKAIPNQLEDGGEVIQGHDYDSIKDKPIAKIDQLEEEKIELEKINAPVIKYTKLWIKHKIWELDSEGKQYTYDFMGDLESHSTSKEEEVNSKGKEKVGSPLRIKTKGAQVEAEKEKKINPSAKRRNVTSKEKTFAEEEEHEEEREKHSLHMPKRRRIVRLSQKKKESSKVEDETDPPVVNVESSREKTQVYTRRSITPPKDSVPKGNIPSTTPTIEQHDDALPSLESHDAPSESKDAEDHKNQGEEGFQKGELYSAEAEIEKILQSPLVS